MDVVNSHYIKPYAVFAWWRLNAQGGFRDFRDSFATLEEAQAYVEGNYAPPAYEHEIVCLNIKPVAVAAPAPIIHFVTREAAARDYLKGLILRGSTSLTREQATLQSAAIELSPDDIQAYADRYAKTWPNIQFVEESHD